MKKHYLSLLCRGPLGLALASLVAWVGGSWISQAASVRLAWDPIPDSDLAGYRLYWGIGPGLEDRFVEVGNVTEWTIPDLSEGTTYYFVATARNSAGVESLPSEEVEYTVPRAGTGGGGAGGGGVDSGASPIASNISVVVSEDVGGPIVLAGSDPLGRTLTYGITLAPLNGTLTGTSPLLTYRPNANFSGTDSFQYRVSAGSVDSTIATVSIAVTPVNDAPTAFPRSASVQEDGFVPMTLGATDVDSSALSFAISRAPLNGRVEGTPPSIQYRPFTNFFGTDSFEYTVSDGALVSAPSRISITVLPVNDPPTAGAQSLTVNEDGVLPITLTGQDPDGSPLTFAMVRAPALGALTGTAPSLTYVPSTNVSGTDSFEFRVTDASGASGVATVQIVVRAVNDIPVANAQSVTVLEGGEVPVNLSGTDVEGTALTFAIATAPAFGALSGTAPALIYRPRIGYSGSDSFEFTVSDGVGVSGRARVTIQVTAVNSPPNSPVLDVRVPEDGAIPMVLTAIDPDGDPLTIYMIRFPSNGYLLGTAPRITYQPRADFSGTDRFFYGIDDGRGGTALGRVDVTVDPVNDAPVARALTATVPRNGSVAITLAGTDIDSAILTYGVDVAPRSGTLTGTAPNLTYTPAANFVGTDSFRYVVRDESSSSSNVLVSIEVTSSNRTPTVAPLSVTVLEDTPSPISLSAVDPDGDSLVYSILRAPSKGTLQGTAPALTYQPGTNYAGPDSFDFRVDDGNGGSVVATATIQVQPVNDPPSAAPMSLTVLENGSVSFILGGADVEGTSVVAAVATQPVKGTLSGTPPNLTYRPLTNLDGADSFDFRVDDGTNSSALARVSIVITPVNSVPTALAQAVSLAEDSSVSIRLAGQDADGDVLSFALGRLPSRGTLTGTPPNVIYIPNTNYAGPDSFEFTVRDGAVTSTSGLVSLTVTPVGDPPVATSGSTSGLEDTAIPITLSGSDPDGDPLTFAIALLPRFGTLTGSGTNWIYRPNTNRVGVDSIQFSVNDGIRTSVAGVMTINVTPVNDAPTALGQSVSLAEDSSGLIRLAGLDVDGDALTFALGRMPTNGILSGTPPNITYTPHANYAGSDSFEFLVRDGAVTSPPALVSLMVTPVSDVPVATAASVSGAEDSAIAVTLSGSDPDRDALTYQVTVFPLRGVLSGTPPALVYRPDTNFAGVDSFQFTANDGTSTSVAAVTTLLVTPVNDAPTATPQSVSLVAETSLLIQLTGQDVDGDVLTYSLGRLPTNGVISGTPPLVTYTPRAGYSGTDSFEFAVHDGVVSSGSALVTLAITPANVAPVAVAGTVTGAEDSTIPVVLSGTDADGDVLTYTVVVPPQRGVLSGVAPALFYRPETNFFGADTLQFTVSDGTRTSLAAVMTLQVTAVNDAPTGSPQTLSLAEDSTLALRLLGQDGDGDALVYTISNFPTNGTLTGALPNVIYTPRSNYAGADSFRYTVRDASATSTPQLISLTVTPINDAPAATASTILGAEDTSISVTLTGVDPDGDSLTYSVLSQPLFGVLSGTPPNLTYLPSTNFTGTDSFQVVATDGTLASAAARVTLNVTPVNDPPVATASSVIGVYGTPLSINLTGSDPEGSPLTYRVVTSPTLGTLSGTAPSLVYTPAIGFSGLDSFSIVANDGELDSAVAVVRVRISLTLVTGNQGTLIPTAPATQGDSLMATAGDSMVARGDAPPTASASVEWLALPAHGVVEPFEGGGVSYEPLVDGATLDSFEFRVQTADGVSESTAVSLHIVGIHEMKRAPGRVDVSFPTIAGLTYRLEWNDGSPAAAAAWEILHELTPEQPGIVTWAVPTPAKDMKRFVRLTCEGLDNRVVTESWGILASTVTTNVDGRVYSVPFQGPLRFRGRAEAVTGSAITLHGGAAELPSFAPEDGQPTHALFSRSSKIHGSVVGTWWPITGQSSNRVQVDERIESLADCVATGDDVEVVRLLTVADVFGKAGSEESQLLEGDQLLISGYAGEDFILENRASNRGVASYWVIRDGITSGPFDGSTLSLLPFQTFYFMHRSAEGPLVLAGRVKSGPAVHYVYPGARMVGNAFPLVADVPELAPYQWVGQDYPWLEAGTLADPDWNPPWVKGTGSLEAGEGRWVRIPGDANPVRWVQYPPWTVE